MQCALRMPCAESMWYGVCDSKMRADGENYKLDFEGGNAPLYTFTLFFFFYLQNNLDILSSFHYSNIIIKQKEMLCFEDCIPTEYYCGLS